MSPARRDALLVLGSVAAVSVLLVVIVAVTLVRSRADAVALGASRSSNLALLIEEQTRRTVQAIDLSLGGIVDTLRLAPQTPSHDPVLTKRLQSRLRELPYVRALFVIGADGFLIQDTDADTPNVSLADRDYFRIHAETPDAGLFIGQPLKSRSPAAPWFLSMSRRISLEDGRFYGVAVAALEPRYFARFYGDIDVGAGGSVSLVHRSGTIVARSPDYERAVGTTRAQEPLFTTLLPAARSGTFVGRGVMDGVERLFSYRAVDPAPLVVVVGLSTEALLADWWRSLRIGVASVAAVVLSLLGSALLLVRRRARERLAAERLQQIDRIESLAQMTSSVAHDFNNLLAIIGGNVEIVMDRLAEDDPMHARLGKALDAADRGARIVAQLLAFASRRPVESKPEIPARLLDALADLLRQAVKPCALVLEAPSDPWICDIDAGQFERAVVNLAVNARDASPAGAPVRIAAANLPRAQLDRVAWPDLAPDDYVAVRVTDEGAGMPAEVARRACEPFFTTKGEGRGTGLGLSQAFAFARHSGGGLTIASEEGRGTTVTVLLPRSTRTSPGDATTPAVPEVGAVA